MNTAFPQGAPGAAPSPAPVAAPARAASSGFVYSQPFFAELVERTLAQAKKLGASDAQAEASEGCGLSVSVRKGELENVEHHRDKLLDVTVYCGQRHGHASTSDLSERAVAQTVRAAWDIARYTAEDPQSGLPDAADIATPDQQRDLDLFHPWALDTEAATALALECEAAAFATSRRITNSEGASVWTHQSQFLRAHTRGFRGGYASSGHSLSVAPIAALPGRGGQMQRDAWYSHKRAPAELAAAQAVGRHAAARALSRLGSRKMATTQCPVLFEAPLAAGLLGAFVHAISGGAQYRKSSFLPDALGQQVFAKHINIQEDPFVARGNASTWFDDEGVRVAARQLVQGGSVQGYLLDSYAARKLGMQTTGNAGGAHNLQLTSRLTRPGDDLDAMLRKLDTGLFVIELMGQGVNHVTGDYSRGASGFWVERGQIAWPVHEITIAGNLKQMFRDMDAIGADAYTSGSKTVGSVLVKRMKVAGS